MVAELAEMTAGRWASWGDSKVVLQAAPRVAPTADPSGMWVSSMAGTTAAYSVALMDDPMAGQMVGRRAGLRVVAMAGRTVE